MDDSQKRSLLVVAAITAAALLSWMFLAPPEPPANTTRPPAAGSGARNTPATSPAALGDAQRRARSAAQRTAIIETPDFRATFSNLNTGLVGFTLKGERFTMPVEGSERRAPIEIVTTDKEQYFPLRVELGGVPVPADAVWQLEQLSPTAVRFTWEGGGFRVARKIEAGSGPYQLWSTVRVTNTSAAARPVRVNVWAHHYVKRADEGGGFLGGRSPAISQGVCRGPEGTKRFERKDLLAGYTLERVGFAGTENTYFATLLAPDRGQADFCTLKGSDRFAAGEEHGTLLEARLAHPRVSIAPGASATVRTLAYVGPKDAALLAQAGHGLTDAVDLGFFSIIARAMVQLLGFIHGFVGNWGLAIILMTVCVKLVLFPLTLSQLRSMAKMRQLKPELDKLNDLYGDDREKKGAATMELYRRHGVNPVAGCLPSLAQLPVWWALYTSLSTNLALFHMPFALWLTDLTSPDPYFLMPLALGVLMWVQQRMTPTTMDPAQAKIMQWMMPIMITAFMLFLPQGLTLYMFTNSALGIAQQRYIEYRLAKSTASAEVAAVAGDGAQPAGVAGAEESKATGTGSSPQGPGKKPGKAGSARRTGRG